MADRLSFGFGNPNHAAAFACALLPLCWGWRRAAKSARRCSAAALTAFGEPLPGAGGGAFFTGKPQVEGLGYAFLYRNYRPDLAKWQTSDPLGYPDGWNQLAYCNNWVTECADLLGAVSVNVKDMYNGYRRVRYYDDLRISRSSTTGREHGNFSCDSMHINYDQEANELIVDIDAGIQISSMAVDEQSLGEAAIAIYGRHTSIYNDAYLEGSIVYGAVLCHELGHARSFFADFIPSFMQRLMALERRLATESLSDYEMKTIATDIFNATMLDTLYRSNKAANDSTLRYFDSSPFWEKISDNGLEGIWKRVKQEEEE